MKKGATIWLCGLAGSGKSTLAKELARLLREDFDNVVYLDGDETREFFESFSYDKKARIEMAFKRAKMAKFLNNEGQIVIVSTISLFDEVYEFNRKNLSSYFEVFVECDFEELKRRDQKELYTRAIQGLERDVVGVDLEFDIPRAHLIINNSSMDKLDEKARYLLKEFLSFYNAL
ncbi:adenylyl-sulfate kinase [Campylobacter troglodytis]|uniref:adenylyl-sulfate kinase n=1 Tax=Campylobacter troglodytis TaxID=654363 RepID=UPI00115A10E2|nr:adenylyl-sulfate kinase [Campylobacter troglodytis]TQR53145.1 adenylyl-sulfate kinase [Campylobacter troglodytis]